MCAVSTIDACRVLDRRCLAYDNDPKRQDIKQYNIVKQGIPEVAKGCNLVLLDPPYGFLNKKEYSQDSISSLYTRNFLKAMQAVTIDCYEGLVKGGHVAIDDEITDGNLIFYRLTV